MPLGCNKAWKAA